MDRQWLTYRAGAKTAASPRPYGILRQVVIGALIAADPALISGG